MEQQPKTSHQIVEAMTSNLEDIEFMLDHKVEFENFAAVFDEFARDFIHNEKLARRPMSDSHIKDIIGDKEWLHNVWLQHIRTWRDVEIFLAMWVQDQLKLIKF